MSNVRVLTCKYIHTNTHLMVTTWLDQNKASRLALFSAELILLNFVLVSGNFRLKEGGRSSASVFRTHKTIIMHNMDLNPKEIHLHFSSSLNPNLTVFSYTSLPFTFLIILFSQLMNQRELKIKISYHLQNCAQHTKATVVFSDLSAYLLCCHTSQRCEFTPSLL